MAPKSQLQGRQAARDGIVVLADDGSVYEANRRFADMLGYTFEELLQLHVWDWDAQWTQEHLLEMIRQVDDSGDHFETNHRRKDGTICDVEISTNGAMIAGRKYVFCISRDITERKLVEKALRRSEKFLRQVIDASPNCIFIKDWDGRYVLVNKAIAKLYGVSKEKMLGRTDFDLAGGGSLYQEEAEKFLADDRDVIKRETPKRISEESLTKSDGTQNWFYTIKVPLSSDLMPNCMLGVATDITERKQAEEALEAQRAQLKSLFDYSGEAIVMLDMKNHILEVNSGFELTFGYSPEEARGKRIEDLICPERYRYTEAKELDEQSLNGIKDVEIIRKRKDGEEIDVRVSAGPIKLGDRITGRFVVFDNITERKQAEEERERLHAQLSQAQKMEAIGTLAGGIAHDFNNILSIIMGNIEIAMLDVPEWSPAQDNLKDVREATLRARELVKQILMFARQKEQTASNISLEPVAKESLKMLRSSIPTTVEIRETIEKGLPPVLADPSQIQQIIMNLCTNAGQVMEAEGGTLTFTLDSADLEAPLHTIVEELHPGRYVRMQVKDTGPGIPPEILGRLFDPFFTTKDVGEGTGLGLAVVHGIVQDRKGGIIVDSEEGRGTTFTIYLPASELKSAELTAEEKPELPRGTERVLFVDDEPMVMKLGQRMLELQGYTVETRASGTDALECFRQDPNRFDLVVTDMTMPGMRGDRLTEAILAVRPDIPVILCTGYSKLISKEKAREIGIRAFVMKPFTQHELAEIVRKVLDNEV